MSASSFRARELEALRMELRRELRMEANVFAEDDDLDASDGDDGHDAVVGTPARSRVARRPTAASKSSSRPSSRAFKSPSRSHRVDDFSDVHSPMRGLGSAFVAERRPATKPSGRRRDADVVATPTRSEAPPARSAALADRLVLATPRSRAPPSATRGRDRARAGDRADAGERRGRLRSPSLDRLAGTYRSLGALATSARTVSSPGKRVSSSSFSANATTPSRRTRTPTRGETLNAAKHVSREADRLRSASVRRERPAITEDARPNRPRRPASEPSSAAGRDDVSRKNIKDPPPRGGSNRRDTSRPCSSLGSKESRLSWRTVIEYDLHGRRVERKVLAPPRGGSARGRPAWSSRPGTSSGAAASKTRGAFRKTARLDASRPAFDPGPGGLGIEHRTRRETQTKNRSSTTPSLVRYRSATETRREEPSPSPARRRGETSPSPRRGTEPSFVSSPDSSFFDEKKNDDAYDAYDDDRRREKNATNEVTSEDARRRDVRDDEETSTGSRRRTTTSADAAEKFVSAREQPTRNRETETVPTPEKKTSPNPNPNPNPNPFVDVRDDFGDALTFVDGAAYGAAPSRPATARSRVRTPSTSGRRAALGGFDGNGSAFGRGSRRREDVRRPNTSLASLAAGGARTSGEFVAGYHRAEPPSVSASPARGLGLPAMTARRPRTAGNLPGTVRVEPESWRTYAEEGVGSHDDGSFDDIVNRAFGMAHAPSPSRYAERHASERFAPPVSPRVLPRVFEGDARARDEQRRWQWQEQQRWQQPQQWQQQQQQQHWYGHHSYAPAHAYAPAPYAAPAYYEPPYYEPRDAWYRRAPPSTGAAESFQRWSRTSGGYY